MALFNLKKLLNIHVEKEYKELFNDLYKYFVILSILIILSSYSNSQFSKLLLSSSKEILLFCLIGLCFYHLVMKRLIEL